MGFIFWLSWMARTKAPTWTLCHGPKQPPRGGRQRGPAKYHYKQAQEVKLTLGSVYLEEDIWIQHHQPP